MKRINEVLTNPQAVDIAQLAGTAPNLAVGLAQQALTNAQFLNSKAPKNPYPQGIPAFAMPWKPSDGDLEKFYRYMGAVERPNDVLKQLSKTGDISPEAAETMRAVYPQLLESMKQKMMDRVMEMKEPLSYEKKRGLSSAFGADFIGANMQQLALLQQLHSANVQGTQGAPARDGRQTHTQEDNMSTQAQRVEAGRSK